MDKYYSSIAVFVRLRDIVFEDSSIIKHTPYAQAINAFRFGMALGVLFSVLSVSVQ